MTDINICGGFFGALTLLLVCLKLTGHITWSWFWVVCPMFIHWVILIVLLAVIVVLGLLTD